MYSYDQHKIKESSYFQEREGNKHEIRGGVYAPLVYSLKILNKYDKRFIVDKAHLCYADGHFLTHYSFY